MAALMPPENHESLNLASSPKKSRHADSFVLKGGLMLQLWGASLTRATKDIDLHRAVTVSVDDLESVIRDCIGVQGEDDGLLFDAESRAHKARILPSSCDLKGSVIAN